MMHKTVSCHNCLCFGFLWRIWVRWCFTQVSKNGGKRMSLITFVLPAPPSESFVFGSHNWDSSSISGFLSTIQNENRKKQGPGVIIKYCCSMGIWWMIIVSTFLWLHQRILNSSIPFISYRFLNYHPTYVYTWCITNRKNSEIEVLSPSITKECRVITRRGYYHYQARK